MRAASSVSGVACSAPAVATARVLLRVHVDHEARHAELIDAGNHYRDAGELDAGVLVLCPGVVLLTTEEPRGRGSVHPHAPERLEHCDLHILGEMKLLQPVRGLDELG